MAEINIQGSAVGSMLRQLLMCADIEPGSSPSYQACKTIYEYHPLGKKMAEKPIDIAMSQERKITVPNSPETLIVEAFQREWGKLGINDHIKNVMRLSRIYGIASVAYGADDIAPDQDIKPQDFYKLRMYFNILDPLNTSGSLVLNQDPNSPDFQKHGAISVSGKPYHRSRSCTIMNEAPIYISYTPSAFGFVGRSVYQRSLYPLKSFVQSMITDDMVTRKAGLLIAMMKQAGSIVSGIMQKASALKRSLLKEAETDNVLTIGHDDKIETLNMQNTDTAMTTARKNILENIAAGADMPAQMLNNETFAEGFGEGTEDAKAIAQYVSRVRAEMQALYTYFDKIVQYRAWNPEFYETIQAQFPAYKSMPYETAFFQWANSFSALWPSLLIEPDSELIKVEDVKFKAIIGLYEALAPGLDPENKATMMQWAADNFNEQKLLFSSPLVLDWKAAAEYVPPAPAEEPNPEKDS